MTQRSQEASVGTENRQQENIQTPDQFKEKYNEHQAEILSKHNKLFNTLANPFSEDELDQYDRPSLADPDAWDVDPMNPHPPKPFQSAANKQKVQNYHDELQDIREEQQQELKDLLDKYHNKIETLEVPQNSYQLSSAMASMQTEQELELNKLHKKHETQINQFLTDYKADIKTLYDDPADPKRIKTIDAKEPALKDAVKKSATEQRKEQAKIYQDAKSFTDIACNYARAALIEKYRSDQDIIQIGKQGANFAQLPNIRREVGLEDVAPLEDLFENPLFKSTVGLASLGGITKMGVGIAMSALQLGLLAGIGIPLLAGTMGFGIQAFTTNITASGMRITPAPAYGYTTFLGIEYFQKWAEGKLLEKETERWLARNPDWTKPAIVYGAPHTVMAIARTLARNGFDPDSKIQFKDNQPTTEEWAELRKEYQKWMIKQQQSPHQLGPDGAPADKIKPFSTASTAQTSVSMLST